MTYEEALRKAAACLKLAADRRGSPEECALAASKAQEIMDRYEISHDAASSYGSAPEERDTTILDPGEHATQVNSSQAKWVGYLVDIIGRHNGCESYWVYAGRASKAFCFVGRRRDIDTSKYLLGLLEREVYRISGQECVNQTGGYRCSFRFGIVDAIKFKLHEQKQETNRSLKIEASAQSSTALIRIEAAIQRADSRLSLVVKWLKENKDLKEGRRVRVDGSARAKGFQAGQQIKINRATAALA